MPSLPEIVAHRGTPRERRENTLPAFALALEQGAAGIELDVHASADGVVVVHHDSVLTAGVEPAELAGQPIASLDAAALATVRLPSPLGDPAPLPTLAEVVALVDGRATLYVEIKAEGIERAVEHAVAASRGPVAVHGFDHRVSRRVADGGSGLATGILVYSRLVDAAHALRVAGARDYWCWWEFLDAESVADVHAAGGRVVAWTVNDADVARRLAGIGVDAICTDVPAEMRAAIGDPG